MNLEKNTLQKFKINAVNFTAFVILLLAIPLVTISLQQNQDNRSSAAVTYCKSTPFTSGTEGYHTFRIPAIVRAQNGTILAFAEGRRTSGADTGDIDIVLKRSTDGGCTWGPLQVITTNGSNTAGNPAPVVDPVSGKILLVSCQQTGSVRTVFVQESTNHGVSWSSPRDITASVKQSNWRWYATGPGHAIYLATGAKKGRIVIPANHSIRDATTGVEYNGGHTLFSDDLGLTWKLGFIEEYKNATLSINETTAAQLPDGRIYFNARDQNGTSPANRADTYSADGGQTLTRPYQPQNTITTPVVQGSTLQIEGGKLIYSGPTEASARKGMAIRTSSDGGVSWQIAYQVAGATVPAAYSDLVQLDTVKIGLFYETGSANPYQTISFVQIPISSIGGSTITPTPTPTKIPTPTTTVAPTAIPTKTPTPAPTAIQTATPTSKPIISYSFTPDVDTYARSDNPSSIFNSSTSLYVDGSPIAISYLKYNLTGLAGKKVISATLAVRTNGESSLGTQNVKAAVSNWYGTTLTYNNKPTLGTKLATINSKGAKNTTQIVNITSYVQANVGQWMSLGIDTTASDGIEFSSMETSYKPTLTIQAQ